MSKVTRKVFSKETKAKVALEAVKGFKTINEIATEFGVHPTQVGMWKKQFIENMSDVFETKRGPEGKSADELEAANARLYAQIGRLTMDLEWLKKSQGSAPSNEN
jgi:transposase-like protein